MPTSTANKTAYNPCGEVSLALTATAGSYSGTAYTHTLKVLSAGSPASASVGPPHGTTGVGVTVGTTVGYFNLDTATSSVLSGIALDSGTSALNPAYGTVYGSLGVATVTPSLLSGTYAAATVGQRPYQMSWSSPTSPCWGSLIQMSTSTTAGTTASPAATIRSTSPVAALDYLVRAWQTSSTSASCAGGRVTWTKSTTTDPQGFSWAYKGTLYPSTSQLAAGFPSAGEVVFYANYTGSGTSGATTYTYYTGRVHWRASGIVLDSDYWKNNMLITIATAGNISTYSDTASDSCNNAMRAYP